MPPLRTSGRLAALALITLGAAGTVPVASSAPAVDVQDKQKTSEGTSEGFVLEVGEHHLRDILVKAAKFLGRTILLSKAELGNESLTVEIHKTLNLDAIGCEEVVSQLAYSKGFAIVPVDTLRGLYEAVSTRGPRVQEIAINALHMSPDEVLRKSRLKMQVLTSVPLAHIDAAKAAQHLRPFFASAGGRNSIQFGNSGSSKSLLVQGYASNVAGAIRLLREVDQPQDEVFPKTYLERLHSVELATNQYVNSLRTVQQRLAALEAQLAAIDPAKKKER